MDQEQLKKMLTGIAASAGSDVVPFGKYRGQPLEVLRTDPDWCQWALDNGVVSETKYRNVYVFLTGAQGESHETPEHNRYQVLFLDQAFANSVWDKLFPGVRVDFLVDHRVHGKLGNYSDYKKDEWNAEEERQRLRSIELEDLYDVQVEFEVSMRPFSGPADVQLSLYGKIVRIEIKPTMGDDYPAVLRQMKASGCNVLYLVKYAGIGATLDQVKKLFKMSGITIVEHCEVK